MTVRHATDTTLSVLITIGRGKHSQCAVWARGTLGAPAQMPRATAAARIDVLKFLELVAMQRGWEAGCGMYVAGTQGFGSVSYQIGESSLNLHEFDLPASAIGTFISSVTETFETPTSK